MCSWCWAFRPAWKYIADNLPEGIAYQNILGGLAPDSDQIMPVMMQNKIRITWKTIQQKIPGTKFNFEFWQNCQPRRSTYPACRAVLAAMRQGTEFEEPVILAIQRAYYLRALNPSDPETLIRLAIEIGLNEIQFVEDLNSLQTQAELLEQISFGKRIGAYGFPSLILETATSYRRIPHDYNNARPVLEKLKEALTTPP